MRITSILTATAIALAAAVAAGRSGAKTLLLEREGCLGGGMTTMLVHPFMPNQTGGKIINAGIFMEIAERVWARGIEPPNAQSVKREVSIIINEIVAEKGGKDRVSAGMRALLIIFRKRILQPMLIVYFRYIRHGLAPDGIMRLADE